MNKIFSIITFLLLSLFNSATAYAVVAQSSTNAVIQQAETNALRNLENQLPREKPNTDAGNDKANNAQAAQPPQTITNAPSNMQAPNSINPVAPASKPQQNPWVKSNPWAEPARQNPWANQPLPPAPNTAPINQTGVSTLPPPPNIFAVPSATPVSPQSASGATANPANTTPNTKP